MTMNLIPKIEQLEKELEQTVRLETKAWDEFKQLDMKIAPLRTAWAVLHEKAGRMTQQISALREVSNDADKTIP